MLISTAETDMSQLTNKSHNTDDVLEKVDENYKTERIADELAVLKEICLDESELNMEYNTRAFEKFSIAFLLLNLLGKMKLCVTK